MSDLILLTRETQLAGRKVGRLAYGCWRFAGSHVAAAQAKVEAALSVGANVLDTAAIYGFGAEGFGDAEARLGDLFASQPGLRDQVAVVTKGGIAPPEPYDSRAASLIESAENSLRRLRSEQVELFLIHRPDNLVHPAEMAEALTALRDSGKIAEAGVSNFSPAQLSALQAHLDFPLAATQPEISLSRTEPLFDGVLDQAMELGVLPMAWSPLGGGALMTGSGPICTELDRIAGENGADRGAVALAWLLAHPAGIMPIIGSQNPDRIRAAGAAFDLKMTRRDWYALLEASLGHKMP